MSLYIRSLARNGRIQPIAKTITWRVLATTITGLVAYIFTGSFGEASKITIVAAVLLLTATYYGHERFWMWLRTRRRVNLKR